jgi:Eukaryotic protein of unknown function (DUF1764)
MAGTKAKSGKSKETVPESAKKPKAKPDKPTEKKGLDEIDSLFAERKKQKQESATKVAEAKKRHKSSSNKPAPRASSSTTDWVDDGLGGKYNAEGYTGRVEDGMKIFKTHLLQSSKSGTTPDCPFDCDCCFI